MVEFYYAYYLSPIGWIGIKTSDQSVGEVSFVDKAADNSIRQPPVATECISQLKAYFAGERTVFDLPVFPAGTNFQQRVWDELMRIPYAHTISYLTLARQLGNEKSIRAVANANGQNPLAIIIPCHRVIGSDGSLTGYAGGLHRKQWLLDHEAKTSGTYAKLF